MILCVIAASLVGPKVVDLIPHSRAISSTKSWLHLVDLPPTHSWVDNDHVAFLISENNETHCRLMDVRTGKSDVLGFSTALQKETVNCLTIAFSPKGDKVLWGDDSTWFIANLDGSNQQEFEQRGNRGEDTQVQVRWAPDGKSVSEWQFEPYLKGKTRCWQRLLTDLDHAKELPKPKHDVTWMPEIRTNGMVYTTEDALMGSERSKQHFVRWNMFKPGSMNKYTISVPSNRTVSNFRISPDGTKILWDLSIYDKDKVKPWGASGTEFWVSDIEGKRWRYQATIKFAGTTAEADMRSLGVIQWRPNGKSFSFGYQDRLYEFTIR